MERRAWLQHSLRQATESAKSDIPEGVDSTVKFSGRSIAAEARFRFLSCRLWWSKPTRAESFRHHF